MNIEEKYLEIKDFAYKYFIERLHPELVYHSIKHTFNDVLVAATKLAEMEKITPYQAFLLKTAILFHDFGFIDQYTANEEIGAAYAGKFLIKFDFKKEEIDYVKRIILATSVTFKNDTIIQSASNDILEQLICDADLDNLGRRDFWDLSLKLKEELEIKGIHFTIRDWCEKQIRVLSNHRYYTKSARRLREKGLQDNIEKNNPAFGGFVKLCKISQY